MPGASAAGGRRPGLRACAQRLAATRPRPCGHRALAAQARLTTPWAPGWPPIPARCFSDLSARYRRDHQRYFDPACIWGRNTGARSGIGPDYVSFQAALDGAAPVMYRAAPTAPLFPRLAYRPTVILESSAGGHCNPKIREPQQNRRAWLEEHREIQPLSPRRLKKARGGQHCAFPAQRFMMLVGKIWAGGGSLYQA